jgi:hypothetical protein
MCGPSSAEAGVIFGLVILSVLLLALIAVVP